VSRAEYIALFLMVGLAASAMLWTPGEDPPKASLPKFSLSVDGVALGLHEEQIRYLLGDPDFPQWPSFKMPVHAWHYGPLGILFFDHENRAISISGTSLYAFGDRICGAGDSLDVATESAEKLGKANLDYDQGGLKVIIVSAEPGCVTLNFQAERLQGVELEVWDYGNVRNRQYRPIDKKSSSPGTPRR